MRKFLLLFLFLLYPVFCYGLTSGDFTYTVSNDEVTITGYTGSGGALVIPDTIDGDNVVAIGENQGSGVFKNKAYSSITFSSNLETIGNYSFYDCQVPATVTIPDTVTSIGFMSFYLCRGMTTVVIGSAVTSIGDYCFAFCKDLVLANFAPTAAPTIGQNVFKECGSGFQVCYINGSTGYTNARGIVNMFEQYPATACYSP